MGQVSDWLAKQLSSNYSAQPSASDKAVFGRYTYQGDPNTGYPTVYSSHKLDMPLQERKNIAKQEQQLGSWHQQMMIKNAQRWLDTSNERNFSPHIGTLVAPELQHKLSALIYENNLIVDRVNKIEELHDAGKMSEEQYNSVMKAYGPVAQNLNQRKHELYKKLRQDVESQLNALTKGPQL